MRKYVNKEWALDYLPRNPHELVPPHAHETKVFQTLNKMNWYPPPNSPRVVPKDPNAKDQSCTKSHPVHKQLRHGSGRATSEPPSAPTPRIAIPISPDIFSSKDFPSLSIDSPYKNITKTGSSTVNVWREFASKSVPTISITSSFQINNRSDSDYSDDLYGTGRPLRPSLINSYKSIQEWQSSAFGNPEIIEFLEGDFQLDMPAKPEEMSSTSKSNRELAAFLDNDFQACVTSKLATAANPQQNPSAFDDLAFLIHVDDDPVVDAEEVSICNDMIIEEDSSILAEVDAASVDDEYRTTGVNYRCLSDVGTEVDSEFDKIEYEFQRVRPLSTDEMKGLSDEMESKDHNDCLSGETILERELNERDIKGEVLLCMDNTPKDNGSPKFNCKEYESEEDESEACRSKGDDAECRCDLLRSPPTEKQSEIEKQEPPLDHGNSEQDFSLPQQEILQPEDSSKENSVDTSSLLPSDDNPFQKSAKSIPFANIVFTKPLSRLEVNSDIKDEDKNVAKEGLVEFLLRSGLFSVR